MAKDGVIRIGRKGTKKFAFGEDGEPFEVDVVASFQEWVGIDEELRTEEVTANDGTKYKIVPTCDMSAYHIRAVEFAADHTTDASAKNITIAEALDFIARLREQYDELADFFRPKPRPSNADESLGTTAGGFQFSEETEFDPQPSTK